MFHNKGALIMDKRVTYPPKTYELKGATYTIGIEAIASTLDEVKELWKMHWEETEKVYLNYEFDPDVDLILYYERQGIMINFTARCEGKLVGHLCYFIGPNTHITGKTLAKEDWFYVVPEHRGTGVASKLLAFSEEVLRGVGVDHIGMSDKSPIGGTSLEKFLKNKGYAKIAVYYLKEVPNYVL